MKTDEFKEMFYVTIDTNIMWKNIMSFDKEFVLGVYSVRDFLIAVLKKHFKTFVTLIIQTITFTVNHTITNC